MRQSASLCGEGVFKRCDPRKVRQLLVRGGLLRPCYRERLLFIHNNMLIIRVQWVTHVQFKVKCKFQHSGLRLCPITRCKNGTLSGLSCMPAFSTSGSGDLELGWMLWWTTCSPLSTVSSFFVTPRRKMSFGVPCWRKRMPSEA